MIKSSKIAALSAALALVSGLAFADSEVSFTNKLSSDIVEIENNDDDSETSFAGFKNKSTFEYTSDNLDAMLEMTFWSKVATDPKNPLDADDDKDYFAIGDGGYDFGDSYIEFRPFEVLGIEFHEKVFVAGSYLPVLDDNIATGNIGSDLGLLIRPVESLVFGAGLDFISAFGHDDRKPIFNFGVEFANEDFSIGGSVRNVVGDENEENGTDELAFGVFTQLKMIEDFEFNLGFAYNDSVEPDVGAVSGNLLTAGITYTAESFWIGLDAVTNFGNSDDFQYDLYSGLVAEFNLNDNFVLGGVFANTLDFESDDDKDIAPNFQINPYVTVTVEKHEFSAGVNIFFTTENTSNISFPVYWKYKL